MCNQKEEAWRPIPGYEGWYDFSNIGRCRSWKFTSFSKIGMRRDSPKILKPCYKARTKYTYYSLTMGSKTKQYQAHRLSLLTFRGPCPDGMQACHNNGDPADNRIKNLRWDTPKGNMSDRNKHGTSPRGERNGRSRLTREDVLDARVLRGLYGCGSWELAGLFGVSRTTMNQALLGRTWSWL